MNKLFQKSVHETAWGSLPDGSEQAQLLSGKGRIEGCQIRNPLTNPKINQDYSVQRHFDFDTWKQLVRLP